DDALGGGTQIVGAEAVQQEDCGTEMCAPVHQHAGIGLVVKTKTLGALQAMQGNVAARRLPGLGMRLAPEPRLPRHVQGGAAIVAKAHGQSLVRRELHRNTTAIRHESPAKQQRDDSRPHRRSAAKSFGAAAARRYKWSPCPANPSPGDSFHPGTEYV